MSEEMPERMPKRMPEDMPGRMSDRMSGDTQRMSDRKHIRENARRDARKNLRTLASNNGFCQHVVQDTAEFGGNRFECRPEAEWDIMSGKHGGTWIECLGKCWGKVSGQGTLLVKQGMMRS